MIVPTEGIPPYRALLTIGGEIVDALNEPRTVSELWIEIHDGKSGSEGSGSSVFGFRAMRAVCVTSGTGLPVGCKIGRRVVVLVDI